LIRSPDFVPAPFFSAPARSRFGAAIYVTEAVLLVNSVGLLSVPDPAGAASFDFCRRNFLHPLSRFCAPGVPLVSLAACLRFWPPPACAGPLARLIFLFFFFLDLFSPQALMSSFLPLSLHSRER
jgi:hypothetical protein